MPTAGLYGEQRHRQQWVFTQLIPRDIMPPRDVPMPTWEIRDGGRDVRVTGPYDTIWYACRIGGAKARAALESGAREVTVTADNDITITLTVCH